MDIHEMIIKCKFLLQKVNSNVYNSITEEEWCDILNITIDEFVRVKAYDPIDNNRDDYEIRNYYEGIQSLIRTYTFNNPTNYVYTSSKYVDFGVLSNIGGSRFLSKPPIYSGRQYRILTRYSNDDFTIVGARTNDVGELFTANFIASVQPTMIGGAGGTVLRYGLTAYTNNTTNIYAGIYYTVLGGTVTFPVGYPNRVTVNGVDYYLSGVNQNRTTSLIVNVGSSFIIHEIYNVTWLGSSILEEITEAEVYYKYISSLSETTYTCNNTISSRQVQNRLVKSDFVELHRQHSRGAVISSPLCTIEGNKLIVYHNNNLPNIKPQDRFDVTAVTVKYFKRPNRVSVNANISCDLDEIVHEEIIRKAVDSVAAAIGSGTWQSLKTETVSKQVAK